MANLVNTTLGSCNIVKLLGKGGMGEIYLAQQPILNRTVAVKVIRNDIAQEPDFIQRFEHEARTLAALEHPYILPLYEYGYQNDLAYFVMPYITGGTLGEKIKQSRLSIEEAIRILEQLANALDFAHRRAIVHRDIKPANVLLREDGWPLLADFGIAKLVSHLTHVTASPVGTPLYMAPEQWRGQNVTGQTDIYALGIMMYELLAGVPPFRGGSWGIMMQQHLNDVPNSICTLNPAVSPPLEQVVFKAIAKEPARRFTTALEFATSARRAFEAKSSISDSLSFERHNSPIFQGISPEWRADPFVVPPAFNPQYGTPPVLPGPDELAKQTGVSSTEPTHIAETEPGFAKHASPLAHQQAPVQQFREIPLMMAEWTNLPGAIDSLVLLPKTRRVFSGILNTIFLWEAGVTRPLAQLAGHTRAIWALRVTADGQFLISGSWDQTVRIWDIGRQQQKRVLLGHSDIILALTLAMTDQMLVTASRDGTMRCWDLPYGRQSRIIRHPGGAVWSVLTLPSDDLVIAGSENGSLGMWNLKNGQAVWHKSLGNVGVVQRLLLLPSQQILCLTEKGAPVLLDIPTETLKPVSILPVPRPDNAVLLDSETVYTDVAGNLYRWNIENGLQHFVFYAHQQRVSAMAAQSATGIVATGSVDRSMRLWQFFQQ